MSALQSPTQITLSQETHFEFWSEIRSTVKKATRRLVLVATFYLMMSLIIGAFLLQMMEKILRELVYINGFSWEEISFQTAHPELRWIHITYQIYLAVAVCVGIGSILNVLFLADRLPGRLSKWMARTPLIGSTIECLAAAELCQSVFRSISEELPYHLAFKKAASEINHSHIRCWTETASNRLEQGEALSVVVNSVPLNVPPMAVLSSVSGNEMSREQALQLWENAAEESHFLSQARSDRTGVFVSNVILLISVFIASYAIYCSTAILLVAMEGLS